MTQEELNSYTRKELARLAKRYHVVGWHPMKKAELIKALVKVVSNDAATQQNGNGRSRKNSANAARNGRGSIKPRTAKNGRSNGKSNGQHRDFVPAAVLNRQRDLSFASTNGSARGGSKDRLTIRVCDSHWVEAVWSVSNAMVARAEAAMGLQWHQSIPVIRVFDMTADDSVTSAKTIVKDVTIHGQTTHWYIEIDDPSRTYEFQVGYRSPTGKFFVLARSNTVNASQAFRGHSNSSRADTASTTYAHHAVSDTDRAPLFDLADNDFADDDLPFQLDAELVVSGITDPTAQLTVLGTPVTLEADGSFAVKLNLAEGRQLISAVAVASHGREQRTIILAVERNTKSLEPQVFEYS